MLIREVILVALAAIRANALRSFLTTLGIIIGVSAVIAMVSLGEGAQRNVEEQISRMGTNVLTIRAERRRSGGVSREDTEDLEVTDAEALAACETISRLEGIIPALETAHAVAAAQRLGRELGSEGLLLVGFSGRGDKDMPTLSHYLSGKPGK